MRALLFYAISAICIGCAHQLPPSGAAPAPEPVVAETAPEVAPEALPEAEPAVAPPAGCAFSPAERERFAEFVKIRNHLRQQVFPQWGENWPHMVVYGKTCQFILNYIGSTPEGFSLSTQTFALPGFESNAIYFRENAVALPEGSRLSYFIPAQAFTYGWSGTEKWFVMASYDVWQRDYGDTPEVFYGMLAHELFHSFQFRAPGLKARMEALSEEPLTRFCRKRPECAQRIDEERSLLIRAVLENDPSRKKALTREFLEHMGERRSKLFVGEQAAWRRDEPLLLLIEGTAEYLNFRVLTECPLANCPKLSLNDAIKRVAYRPSYLQDLGVLMTILLNQTTPGWQETVFRNGGAAESMLAVYAGLDPRVTR